MEHREFYTIYTRDYYIKTIKIHNEEKLLN